MKYLFSFFLFSFLAYSQSDTNPCETLSQIDKLIKYNHYKVKPIDDSLSVYTFKTFISKLDEDARLFLEPEMIDLKKHQYKIDDYINQKECSFLDEIYEKYTTAINRYEKVVDEIIREPFQFKRNDTIQFSKKNFPHPKNEADLKKIFQKSILFYVLKDVAETSKNKDSLILNFESIALLAKDKVLESYKCKTDAYRMSKADFYSVFYNSFCSYFDPHTNYLSQSDRSSFYRD